MESALKNVKKTLERVLNKEQIEQVLAAQKSEEKYKGKFAAFIAMDMGMAKPADFDRALADQARDRIKAATIDLEKMVGNDLDLASVPKPFFGPGGKVNAPDERLTIEGAATAASNIAELMISLAAKAVEKGTLYNISDFKDLSYGILAAKNLTYVILGDDPKVFPLNRSGIWMQETKGELRILAEKSELDDPTRKTLEVYIDNRIDTDIKNGIELARKKQMQNDMGPNL